MRCWMLWLSEKVMAANARMLSGYGAVWKLNLIVRRWYFAEKCLLLVREGLP